MSSKTGRRSRDETAALIREAAVGLLQRDGLRGFSNSVRLDDALTVLLEREGVRLTHGSIYGRIWVDQRDFQLDVVSTTVARYDGADIAAAIVAAAERTRPAGTVTATTSVENAEIDEKPADAGRAATSGDETSGDGGVGAALFAAAVEAARASRMWNLWLGAHSAVVSTPGPEDDERLAGALTQAQAQVTSSLARALAQVTGRPQATDRGGPAQRFLTQLVGASITNDSSAATAILAEVIDPL